MKKLLFIGIVLILSSCAHSKTFNIDGTHQYTAQPYGWANYEENHDTAVVYEPCIGNIVWSILGSQTVVVPVVLTGWYLFEPIQMKNPQIHK